MRAVRLTGVDEHVFLRAIPHDVVRAAITAAIANQLAADVAGQRLVRRCQISQAAAFSQHDWRSAKRKLAAVQEQWRQRRAGVLLAGLHGADVVPGQNGPDHPAAYAGEQCDLTRPAKSHRQPCQRRRTGRHGGCGCQRTLTRR
jgi:hypothetical protein